MTILIDTNILLDVLEARAPHVQWSSEVWTLAENGDISAHVAAISFSNVFYILRKQRGGAAAMRAIADIRSIFKTVSFDEALLDEAIATNAGDLEDALPAASARRVNAGFVVTRNAADFRLLGVEAITPVEFLARISP